MRRLIYLTSPNSSEPGRWRDRSQVRPREVHRTLGADTVPDYATDGTSARAQHWPIKRRRPSRSPISRSGYTWLPPCSSFGPARSKFWITLIYQLSRLQSAYGASPAYTEVLGACGQIASADAADATRWHGAQEKVVDTSSTFPIGTQPVNRSSVHQSLLCATWSFSQ